MTVCGVRGQQEHYLGFCRYRMENLESKVTCRCQHTGNLKGRKDIEENEGMVSLVLDMLCSRPWWNTQKDMASRLLGVLAWHSWGREHPRHSWVLVSSQSWVWAAYTHHPPTEWPSARSMDSFQLQSGCNIDLSGLCWGFNEIPYVKSPEHSWKNQY